MLQQSSTVYQLKHMTCLKVSVHLLSTYKTASCTVYDAPVCKLGVQCDTICFARADGCLSSNDENL